MSAIAVTIRTPLLKLGVLLTGFVEPLHQGRLVDLLFGSVDGHGDHLRGRALLLREAIDLGAPLEVSLVLRIDRFEIDLGHEPAQCLELILRLHAREGERVERQLAQERIDHRLR
jgi:hypothetical protein